jgi:hypothetical protein
MTKKCGRRITELRTELLELTAQFIHFHEEHSVLEQRMARSRERVAEIDARPDICDQTLSAADRVAEVWLKDREVAKLVEERLQILESKSISLLNLLTPIPDLNNFMWDDAKNEMRELVSQLENKMEKQLKSKSIFR